MLAISYFIELNCPNAKHAGLFCASIFFSCPLTFSVSVRVCEIESERVGERQREAQIEEWIAISSRMQKCAILKYTLCSALVLWRIIRMHKFYGIVLNGAVYEISAEGTACARCPCSSFSIAITTTTAAIATASSCLTTRAFALALLKPYFPDTQPNANGN